MANSITWTRTGGKTWRVVIVSALITTWPDAPQILHGTGNVAFGVDAMARVTDGIDRTTLED